MNTGDELAEQILQSGLDKNNGEVKQFKTAHQSCIKHFKITCYSIIPGAKRVI